MEAPLHLNSALLTLNKLGRGGLAEAWLVQDQETGECFVRKKLICATEFYLILEACSNRAAALLRALEPLQLRVQRPLQPYAKGEAIYEYIPGQTLKDESKEKPHSVSSTRKRLAQALDTVFEFAGAALAHCDVRPENMVVTPEGQLYLIDPDFLIKVGTHPRRQPHGPVWYTAPEVLKGVIHSSSDLFSVGVTGWTLLGAPTDNLPSPTKLMIERVNGGFDRSKIADLHASIQREDPALVELLDALVETEPANRPHLSDCIAVLGAEHFRDLSQVA